MCWLFFNMPCFGFDLFGPLDTFSHWIMKYFAYFMEHFHYFIFSLFPFFFAVLKRVFPLLQDIAELISVSVTCDDVFWDVVIFVPMNATEEARTCFIAEVPKALSLVHFKMWKVMTFLIFTHVSYTEICPRICAKLNFLPFVTFL